MIVKLYRGSAVSKIMSPTWNLHPDCLWMLSMSSLTKWEAVREEEDLSPRYAADQSAPHY